MLHLRKNRILFLFLLIATTVVTAQNELKMTYKTPAANWGEALPLGNGRIAAMVYGMPLEEKIQLNEGTFWSGSPYNNVNDSAGFTSIKCTNSSFKRSLKKPSR